MLKVELANLLKAASFSYQRRLSALDNVTKSNLYILIILVFCSLEVPLAVSKTGRAKNLPVLRNM